MALQDKAWYVDGGAMPAPSALGGTNGASGTTLALTGNTTPSGALLVVIVVEGTAASAGTLADGAGNTYSIASSVAVPSAAGFATVFYCANASALTNQSITYTRQGSGHTCSLEASYITGIATATPLDATTTNSATGTSTSPSVTSGTPTQNGEFLFAAALTVSNAGTLSAVSSSFVASTNGSSSSGGYQAAFGNDCAGLAPSTFSCTITNSVGWAAFVVGFKIATVNGWNNVSGWVPSTSYAAGNMVRQSALPAVDSERVFICIGAGTSGSSEPSWTSGTSITRGAKNTDNTVTWQECTGIAAINGDFTNTAIWALSQTWVQGQVIYDSGSGSVQICTTAGAGKTSGSNTFSATAGVTTTDNVAVWTSCGPSSAFTGWQAPHARLACAFAANWGQAGNLFFVASEHAEIKTSILGLASLGTLANPCSVLCVAKSPVPPTAVTTGATISTTGVSSINFGSTNNFGTAYYNGLSFSAGSGANVANINFDQSSTIHHSFNICSFTLANTGASGFSFGQSSGGYTGESLIFNGCTWTFGNTNAQSFRAPYNLCNVKIIGGSVVVGANIPPTLFSGLPSSLCLRGVDLSAFASGTTLIAASLQNVVTILQDCKLGALVTIAATPTSILQEVYLIRSDSSGTNYRHEKYLYAGTQTVETTIVRTGGASDGTQALSWNITTNANSEWVLPFESMPLSIWNDVTGTNRVVTVYGIWGGGAVPKNDDIWMEVEYPGASGNPQGTIATITKISPLAANAALGTDGSTWGTGSTTAFKMVATLSSPQPAMKGPITIRIYAAKPSTTFYIDPLPVLS